MKLIKLFTLFFLSVVSIESYSQYDTLPWCPSGATWYYFAAIVEYVGDTVVLGKKCKKLKFSENFINKHRRLKYYRYMTVENDSVMIFVDSRYVPRVDKYEDPYWCLMYKFNDTLGSSWAYISNSNNCDSVDTIKVIDVDVVDVGGKRERYKYTGTKVNTGFGFSNVLNKIGMEANFFPVANSDCYYPINERLLYSLKCYEDSLRGRIYFNKDSVCEGSELSVYNSSLEAISIYIDDISSHIIVSGVSTPMIAIIYGVDGRVEVDQIHLDQFGDNIINVLPLKSGVHFLYIEDKSKKIKKTFKFIKQ